MAERLSAFERWEVPHFEGPEGDALRERSRGPMTVAQLEAAHDEAFEQGRAAGFAQGLEEGRAAVDEQMALAARSLEEALACLSRPFEALDAEIEQNLVALACATARALLNDALRHEPERVLAVVREALRALPSSERNVVLELHPDDAAIVRKVLNPDEAGWSIREDASVTRGGCRLESNASRIDASVEARLDQVISHVLGGMGEPESPEVEGQGE